MDKWSSTVCELHAPGDRVALRGQAAELLIQATDPAQAGQALFELIAAELKLNVFLLYVAGGDGELECIAHDGLSDAEAAIAAGWNPPVGGGEAPARLSITGHICGVQELEDGATFLKDLGVKGWFGHPLMAGGRLLGILGFGRRWADRFHDEDIAFLESVARYFALALERLRGEAALRESEERLRLAMTTAGFGTIDLNPTTNKIVVSPELRATMGFSPDQKITMEMLEAILHPDDYERVRAARLANYDPEGPGEYSLEHRVIRPNGEVRWVHVRIKAFFAGEGAARRPARLIGVEQDITERKLAEERLRASEERLRMALSVGGFRTFDSNPITGKVLFTEDTLAMLGLPSDQPVDIETIREKIHHPDDRERLKAARQASLDPEGTGELDEEFRVIRPNGEVRWEHLRSQTFFAGEGGARRAVRTVGIFHDTTERKLAERRLRDSEHRLRLAMTIAGLGVFDHHLDQELMNWSPELKAIYGFAPEEPVDVEKLFKAVHPDDLPRMRAFIDRARAGEYFGDIAEEFRITRRDGQMRWLALSASLLLSPDGSEAPRAIGVVQDITERKLAEQRLRESEERLRLAIEAAGFGIFEYDVERDESIWSPELRAIHGLGPDEVIELEKVCQQVHPDDRELYLAPLFAARAGSEFGDYSVEYRIFRTDGEMRWLATRARQLFAPDFDYPKRIIGVSWDITERKLAEQRLRESEERLQIAQELGGVASLEWNHSTDETWVSESYRRIFGLAPDTPVNSPTFQALLHPDDRERVIDFYTNITEDAKRIEIEYRIIRPLDQKLRWIYAAMGVVRDPVTHVIRLAGIALDVTERKRNEERERLLSREVDHRAKNLLSVVQAMVQLTHADTIPGFVEQVKGRIHALGRAHSLLASSRWNGADLLRLIEEEFAPFADDDGRIRLAGPSIALRPAAAQSMALVIHELTTNAAKYGALSTPDGRVEVIWEAGAAAAGQLVLRWRERGGPPVTPPSHFGFGLTHIRGSVERQLGGTLDLQWHADGLACVLTLPARQLVDVSSDTDGEGENGGRGKD